MQKTSTNNPHSKELSRATKELIQRHDEFLDECTFYARLSRHTLDGYRASFGLLCKLVPNINVDLLTSDMMTEFFRRVQTRDRVVGKGAVKRGVKNSTIATYRSKLNRFFKWLVVKKYINTNPFDGMLYPRVVYENRKYLKREQVERVFIAITHNIRWRSLLIKKRNIAFMSVLLYCGLRRGELCGLRMLDVDLERRLLTVQAQTSKSRRFRVIPLNARVIDDIKDYLNERQKKGYITPMLFVSSASDTGLTLAGLKHVVERVNQESGVRFHLHQFRHTFAVNLLNNGCDVIKLKELLGHTDVKMTMIYLRCLPTKCLRVDVERLTFANLL